MANIQIGLTGRDRPSKTNVAEHTNDTSVHVAILPGGQPCPFLETLTVDETIRFQAHRKRLLEDRPRQAEMSWCGALRGGHSTSPRATTQRNRRG